MGSNHVIGVRRVPARVFGGGRIGHPVFLQGLKPFVSFFRCCSAAGESGGCGAEVGGRWGGGGGGVGVFHIASMPKTPAFTVFSPLCTTHCAKDAEQYTCLERPCL